jgi:cobalt-precorrin-6B (C15)-methyltransferase
MWKYNSPGIPDEKFIRGSIPMTKEEIRVVTLAKLRLTTDSIVYDIGAGTGSVTVEIARICSTGKVYAIEREEEGINLIRANCRRFGVTNVEAVLGGAPEALKGLPQANAIFVGGSGGKLEEIIKQAKHSLAPGGRVVINAVALETLTAAQRLLVEQGFADIEIVSLAVTRWLQRGRVRMADALNPVFIISGNI